MGARIVFMTLILAVVGWSVLAAVENASWGEVKSGQKTRPAGKIAHHEKGDIILEIGDDDFLEFLLGQWESRRFNEDDQLEIVRYVFEGSGRVTLYQTLVDAEESIDPLVGNWTVEGDVGIFITWDLGWEGQEAK